MEQKVWQDFHVGRVFAALITLGMAALLGYATVRNFATASSTFNLLAIALIALFVYGFLCALKPRFTAVYKDGLLVGNVANGNYDKLFYKKKAAFLKWGEIKRIEITKKEVSGGRISLLRSFLIVRSKEGAHETFLAQPARFQEAINRVHKQNLLQVVRSPIEDLTLEEYEKQDASQLEKKYPLFSILWVLAVLLAGILVRIYYGTIVGPAYLIWAAMLIVPPFAFGYYVRRMQDKRKKEK